MKIYFKLFTNCLAVKGENRSVIYDLQREVIKFIPNDLYDIILLFKNKIKIKEIINEYGNENKEIINEYIQFLEKNEFGFLCDYVEYDLFPEMDLRFHKSNNITNAIVELNQIVSHNLIMIKKQLETLNCETLNIITYFSLNFDDIKLIHQIFNGSKIKTIELVTKYNENLNNTLFQKVKLLMNRFTKFIIYSSNEDKIVDYSKFLIPIIFTSKNIENFKTCGNVSNEYFSVNKDKVLEAINHNSCLNRKISIDINGNIKNCPSMQQSFGNIKTTTLEQALNHKDFKKYWNITKDQIDVCKDCEFRHVCTDCRAYIEKPNDKYSKPLKCGYSPYTNEWEEWSTNPLKQKTIAFYDMQELIKN